MVATSPSDNLGFSVVVAAVALAVFATPARASTPFHFSTGTPDNKIAAASRPPSDTSFEIETADDFILSGQTTIGHATFTGLLPPGTAISSVVQVVVEFYRVFPNDSDATRTIHVPTRANSPADNVSKSADSANNGLVFCGTVVSSDVTVPNSVQPGGIHPMTGGGGAVSGEAVRFDVILTPPIVLPADHYFFIPQVRLASGEFYWLSAPKPIVAPGTPFTGDLQSWTRDMNLDPDWLRIGTDIVGGNPAPTFNGAFSLDGDVDDAASPFRFSTGTPDNRIAVASRPDSSGGFEIEAADDFVAPGATTIDHATFTGLLPSGAALSAVSQVVVEFYRVFPNDSDATRTIRVPTRTNSPSDNALTSADSSAGTLVFCSSLVSAAATAANSVQPGGIHPVPNQTTLGNGAVSGVEVRIDVGFTPPIALPPDHYFFVPQVLLGSGNFYWLSAPKPIVAPGTPFTPDLQSWTRDANLDPDWLRVGTDIVGGSSPPTFNGAFSLDGDAEVSATPTPTGAQVATPTPTAPAVCSGDCGGSHQVFVYNLITLVDIVLGTAIPGDCALGIPSGAHVDIAFIIRAVDNLLYGCSS